MSCYVTRDYLDVSHQGELTHALVDSGLYPPLHQGGADQWWILGTYPALQQGELTSAGFRGVHSPPPGGADESPSSAVFLQFTENPHEIGNKKIGSGGGGVVGGGGMNQNPLMFYHHDDERFWDRLMILPFS